MQCAVFVQENIALNSVWFKASVSLMTFVLLIGGVEGIARLHYGNSITANIFTYDSEKIYQLKKNFKGEFSGKTWITNWVGYRDIEHPLTPSPGTMRVVAVGDSITFGHGTTADESYPKALERLLNPEGEAAKVEVINTAVPGNSPFQ